MINIATQNMDDASQIPAELAVIRVPVCGRLQRAGTNVL